MSRSFCSGAFWPALPAAAWRPSSPTATSASSPPRRRCSRRRCCEPAGSEPDRDRPPAGPGRGGRHLPRAARPAGRLGDPARQRHALPAAGDNPDPLGAVDHRPESRLPPAVGISTRILTVLHYLLSWPVRLFVVAVILFSLFVDGAGYIYRLTNHEPLRGYAAGMPPHFGDWQLYIHQGLDLSGGTRIEFKISDIPPGQSPATVQQEAIDVIERRINALGTSEPQVSGEGAQHDRILVELAGVSPDRAEQIIGQTGN